LNDLGVVSELQTCAEWKARSQRPYGQSDMARSIRLVILIKNIYV